MFRTKGKRVGSQSVAPAVTQIQIRWTGCGRRLADYVNEVEAGMVIIEQKCPKCGQPHTQVIRRA